MVERGEDFLNSTEVPAEAFVLKYAVKTRKEF